MTDTDTKFWFMSHTDADTDRKLVINTDTGINIAKVSVLGIYYLTKLIKNYQNSDE